MAEDGRLNASKLLYEPEEAAWAIGQSRSTIYAKMASGEIPSVKIGRSRRIPRAALEAYVARLCTEQGVAPEGGAVA